MFNMLTNPRFDQGRFAVEMVMAANESAGNSMIPASFKSLDDEHTPGVFTVCSIIVLLQCIYKIFFFSKVVFVFNS